jgi:hypothetical protein
VDSNLECTHILQSRSSDELISGMNMYKIRVDTCALQNIRWPGKGIVIANNYLILYIGYKGDKYEFGKDLILVNILWVNEIICEFSVKLI